MIEDTELGLKISECPEETFLVELIGKLEEKIASLKVEIAYNQKFMEFDLKQQEKRLEFVKKQLEELKGGKE